MKFYNKLINVLFIFSMLSCSNMVIVGDNARYKNEYKFIKKVVNRFYRDTSRYMVTPKRRFPIPITLRSGGKYETSTLGTCYDFGFIGMITLNSDNWFKLSKAAKFFVIYHELGHCFLNRKHTKVGPNQEDVDIYLDGCGKSIMSPTIQPNWCLRRHKYMYIRELFSEKK